MYLIHLTERGCTGWIRRNWRRGPPYLATCRRRLALRFERRDDALRVACGLAETVWPARLSVVDADKQAEGRVWL
jgi:hypothetical protein